MKIKAIKKLPAKFLQCDIRTCNHNFLVSTKAGAIVVHNSPAICIASSFPGVEHSFVGTKNTFAKTPQIYSTPEEIDAKYGSIPDLANKLKAALEIIPQLNLPAGEIWKGDFLFTKEDLEIQEDGGKQWVIFQPNTLVYAAETSSEIGQRILNSTVGIVFHTKYTGTSFVEAEKNASFDISVSQLSIPPNAFIVDANIPSIAGNVTLTEEETTQVEELLSQAKEAFESLEEDFLDELAGNPVYNSLLNTYENQVVRSTKERQIGDPEEYVAGLLTWIEEQYQAEAETKKTPRGKTQTLSRRDAVKTFFTDNKDSFILLFEMQDRIVEVKELFIRKLNTLPKLVPFVKNADGSLTITGNEGFAVSDIDNGIVKFVSRLEFSRRNFSRVRESHLRESPDSDAREIQVAADINKVGKKFGLKAVRPVASTKYPDVLVTYEGEEIWVEVKMNHSDQLGSPRFYYEEGRWRSTTPGLAQQICKILDEDPETNKFLTLVKKISKKKNPTLTDTVNPRFIEEHPEFVTREEMEKIIDKWGGGYIYRKDSIPMGKFVRKHYSAKSAPASYIQAGDDFYILTEDRLDLDGSNYAKYGEHIPFLDGRGNLRVRVSQRSRKYEILAEIKITLAPESNYSVLSGSEKINPFLTKLEKKGKK